MTLGERLLRATMYAAFDARDSGDRAAFSEACRRVVEVHRALPLIDHADKLGQAVAAKPVLEECVRERTAALEAEVRHARRRALLAEARLAALEPSLAEVVA